jgi:hypothetical protein
MKLKLPVLLLTAFACTVIFSCKKNDYNPTPAKVKIIGKWSRERVEIYEFHNTDTVAADTFHTTSPDYYYWEFKKNYKFYKTSSEGGIQEAMEGIYTLNGNKLKIKPNSNSGNDSTLSFICKIQNDQLLLNNTASITGTVNGESETIKTVIKIWLDKLQ